MSEAHGQRVIWVVDDSHLDAERARRLLQRDYAVRVFEDGSAALEALSSERPPDVLVLDWVMPGITGVEVCRFLRANATPLQSIAILLLTAHRRTEQIVEGLSAGANDFLAKPYADEELSARVASLVRSRELLERAERAEAANRRLLENTPDPLLVLSASRRLTFVNEVAASVLGRPRAQLLGMALGELLPDLDAVLTRPAETLAPGADVQIGGRVFSPSLRVHPGTDEGLTSVLLRDVTERRMLDERRLDFYSIIAHDLRTPLSALMLRTHLMQKDAAVQGSATLPAGFAQIDRNLLAMVAMINDFLELASLDGGRFRLDRTEVDLLPLIERVTADLGPLFEAHQHTFQGPDESVEAHVCADPRRLHQVLSNLIANAIKFTPKGGQVKATVQVTQAHVKVTIEDSGPGIDPSVAPTLFQRYQRADKNVAGTGLGLLIVREIVEAHAGTVGIDSTPGAGARIWFRLPRYESRPAVTTS